MKYIIPYLAAVSLTDLSVIGHNRLSDEMEQESNSTACPELANLIDEGLYPTPYLDFLNPLNLTLPVLKVIRPKGFRFIFEKDVPEEIIQIECKSNINHYTDDEGEYRLYIRGNFSKSDSKWTYTNTEYMLNASDSMYTIVRWGSVSGREYFDSKDYELNSTDIEDAITL